MVYDYLPSKERRPERRELCALLISEIKKSAPGEECFLCALKANVKEASILIYQTLQQRDSWLQIRQEG